MFFFLPFFCLLAPSLSAPVFNTVNNKDTAGNKCPLTTLVRLECPMICVSSIDKCPSITNPNCKQGENLCYDGICRDECPSNLANPCMCGLSSQEVSSSIQSMFPCLSYVAKNVVNYNSSEPNVNKISCLGYLGVGDIPDWSPDLSSDTAYLVCPAVAVPSFRMLQPIFIAFWALVITQLAVYGYWRIYKSLAEKSIFRRSASTTSSKNSKNKEMEISHSGDSYTTLMNDTEAFKVKGLRKCSAGISSLYNIHFTSFGLFVLMTILCLDYYGFITGVGAGLTFGDYNYNGRVFIIIWMYMMVWVLVLVLYRDKLNNHFMLVTSLEHAEYVEVDEEIKPIIFDAEKAGKLTRIVLELEKKYKNMFGKNFKTLTLKIQKTKLGTKYFVYNYTRFLFNQNKFEKFIIETPTNVPNHHGLSSQEALKRLEYIGPNYIPVYVPSYLKAIFNEFMSFFYIYQFMLNAEKKIKKMAEYEDTCLVIRDDKVTEISTKMLVLGDIIVVERGKRAPCDFVLLKGEVIVDESSLTGEATPIRKLEIRQDNQENPGKISTILSGTHVLESSDLGEKQSTGLVIGTGASSEKGKLIVKILSPREIQFIFNLQIRVVMAILTIQGLIWFVLILWLLKKSAVASWFSAMYALVEIISPILPAALVIGQSVAVHNLRKKGIFCVDVPRVVVAGKIQMFCFDKTGTLTNEGLGFNGINEIRNLDGKAEILPLSKNKNSYSRIPSIGLASCHSLSKLQDKMIGNPVDIEMFKSSGWKFERDLETGERIMIPPSDAKCSDGFPYSKVKVIKENEFQHSRLSMSICVQEIDSKDIHIFVKGSFEKIAELSDKDSIPSDYVQISQDLAKEGCYVLALSHKNLGKIDPSIPMKWSRDEMENGGKLVSILSFKNELKPDTKDALEEIREGNTRNVMITGDTALTGIHIARQCGMIRKENRVFLCDFDKLFGELVWKDVDNDLLVSEEDVLAQLGTNIDLSITGKAFEILYERNRIRELLLYTRVFGRMSPENKVLCIELHMEHGVTAMCGDGGNDCGALRTAHVGIALSNAEASIVSPFSTGKKSIYSCVELLSEGRGALATSFANYKFLILYGQTMAIFKVISMYYSATISQAVWISIDGFISVGMCLSISLSKPLKKLTSTRPTARILGYHTMLSTIGQVVINWAYVVAMFVILYTKEWFRCHEFDSSTTDYIKWWLLGDNYEAMTLGLLIMIQFVNCGFISNFGYKFRQIWYKNYVLVVVYLTFVSLLSYIMLANPNRLGCTFRMNCGDPDVLVSLGYPRPNFYIEPYNIPQGHNVLPKNFRIFLWIFAASNTIIGVLWEVLIVSGPIGEYIKGKRISKSNI
ncbi:hypothetical protein BB558_003856 [Smittium angustum]|uniref:Cation-transporting P-type ATPase N-terminal domain-containing protein n=1 Tax=Smittium angustum TaxID=133377 RepID=A0A2U1J4V4_SMIAN|nr:hypothetical protein BB558_003856 [Smittium angustum]